MYEIKAVDDHYKIVSRKDNIVIDFSLTGNSEAEVKELVKMIAMDIGLHKEIYNEAIDDTIVLLEERK